MMIAVMLAAVRLAAPFTDGAVLQREMKVPVWGTADAGEEIRVSFAGQERKGTTGTDGRWRVDLAPMKACCEGRELVVSSGGQAGRPGGRIVVRDVLVGEVWLCSGQSNMGIPWWGDSPRARDRMGYQIGQITSRPLLRSCFLGNGWSDRPQTDERVVWKSCTPEFLLTGGQITNEVLEVFAPQVKEPKALRYLHAHPWRGYLANEAGLPVGAFHIDAR